VSEEQGIIFQNPLTALAELQDQGFRDVAVQSLQVVLGKEYHQVAGLVQGLKNVQGKFGFRNLEMGMPLLASINDCKTISHVLRPELDIITAQWQIRDTAEGPEIPAVVLIGHGTGHIADSAYSQMAMVLKNEYQNVFLGTLDGFPGFDDVLKQVKRTRAQKVMLMPFFLVAGGHAKEDLAGEEPNSWKSKFLREGFQTIALLNSLGENANIVNIFVEHTRKAIVSFRYCRGFDN
jgi:sirohydrochlorin cobaltochelatase